MKQKKTKQLLTGVISATMIAAAGCGNDEELPPVPEGTDCGDWEWEADEGVWECDDDASSHRGHYFYAGSWFASKNSLRSSSAYKSYKSSSSFKGGGSVSKSSSGFGSGSSGGFGG
ncbi:putative membrane protein YgcG [Metabacillus crassostreae]|uniref:aminotransferase yhxA n=1 Tax=Metabacillus crassostreae TaxID=929098 RepID=UPI00195A874E|nr:aminotransferase yhxA [Metabacillus crassostreae]MBM7603812.1 putative membrane protein YgcG [Metabacillus crassostreae]